MNMMEQRLDQDLSAVLDTIASDVPPGALAYVSEYNPVLRSRIDEVEARLAAHRQEVLRHYDAWESALDELHDLWSLAGLKTPQPASADEALDQAA